MITTIKSTQKSDKFPKCCLNVSADIINRNLSAKLEIFKSHTTPTELIDIPETVFSALILLTKGDAKGYILKDIRESNSAIAYMDIEFLNELAILCSKARADYVLVMKAIKNENSF